MKTYARIDNGVVAELIETEGDIAAMFHPSIVWIDVTDAEPQPAVGWTYDGEAFAEPAAPPEPTAEQLAESARLQRDNMLRACDWTVLTDVPMDDTMRSAWSNYRQALRDVPAQAGFPTTITWPTAP